MLFKQVNIIKNWIKYNTARLYKKSNPAITNLYIEEKDDD